MDQRGFLAWKEGISLAGGAMRSHQLGALQCRSLLVSQGAPAQAGLWQRCEPGRQLSRVVAVLQRQQYDSAFLWGPLQRWHCCWAIVQAHRRYTCVQG